MPRWFVFFVGLYLSHLVYRYAPAPAAEAWGLLVPTALIVGCVVSLVRDLRKKG